MTHRRLIAGEWVNAVDARPKCPFRPGRKRVRFTLGRSTGGHSDEWRSTLGVPIEQQHRFWYGTLG